MPGTGASAGVCVLLYPCRAEWGGVIGGGSYWHTGCVYTDANATAVLDVSGVSSFTLSLCNFTDMHGVVLFSTSIPFNTMIFTNCIFNNITDTNGSCIWLVYFGDISGMPTCTITACTFRACTTDSYGGAINAYRILLVITDCRFYACSAYSGGAVYLDLPSSYSYVNPATVRIDSSDFASNIASYGGSVYLTNSNISFAGNRLCGGSASYGNDIHINNSYGDGDYASSCSNSPACRVYDYPYGACISELLQEDCPIEDSQSFFSCFLYASLILPFFLCFC
jgi:hypothetical protein